MFASFLSCLVKYLFCISCILLHSLIHYILKGFSEYSTPSIYIPCRPSLLPEQVVSVFTDLCERWLGSINPACKFVQHQKELPVFPKTRRGFWSSPLLVIGLRSATFAHHQMHGLNHNHWRSGHQSKPCMDLSSAARQPFPHQCISLYFECRSLQTHDHSAYRIQDS